MLTPAEAITRKHPVTLCYDAEGRLLSKQRQRKGARRVVGRSGVPLGENGFSVSWSEVLTGLSTPLFWYGLVRYGVRHWWKELG